MYSTGKFAKMINHHIRTVQRWDNLGILKPNIYTPKGRKLYTHQQYLDYINQPLIVNNDYRTVVYSRVSSHSQKNDLITQIKFIEEHCSINQINIDDVYSDIGSGLNYKRKNFIKLINEITTNKVNKIIIAHKDRLVRFGFEMIEQLCVDNNVELVIINDEKQSPQEEMVNDLMSIIHVFSSRLYGLRTYKNKLKDIIELDETSKEN